MAPSGAAYHVDWIFSIGSDVHVSQHRKWFTSYTPFRTKISSFVGEQTLDIAGIGDVILPVKVSRTQSGRASQSFIVLHDVLFAPKCKFNIIGRSIEEDYDFRIGGNTSQFTRRDTGAIAGILDHKTLRRLRLTGQSPTQSTYDAKQRYAFAVHWSEKESARWETCKGRSGGPTTLNVQQPSVNTQRDVYSMDEKKWLKIHYGNEYNFLQAYGWSIFKEDERTEGRSLVRQFMGEESPLSMEDDEEGESEEEEEEEEEDEDDESDWDEPDRFLRDLEEDPASHMADYHFSAEELNWIETHYRHSANFLAHHGLKAFDPGDCVEGKSIVAMMLVGDQGN